MPVSSPETTCQQLPRLPGKPQAPLMRLRPPSASWREVGVALWVWRNLHVLGERHARRRATLDLEALSGLLLPDTLLTRTDNPPTELRPLQSMTAAGRRTPWYARGATASHEVRGSFSTVHLASPLNPGLPHPVRSAYRVSHPLDGLLLTRLPGLVSCRSAHGVPALQSFPLARSSDASRRPMPSCRWPDSRTVRTRGSDGNSTSPPRGAAARFANRNRHPFTAVAKHPRPARLQGLAPRDESVASPRRLGRRRARYSPGLRTWSGLPARSRVPTQASTRLPRAGTGGAAKGTRRHQTRCGQLAPRRIDSSEVGDVSGTPHRP